MYISQNPVSSLTKPYRVLFAVLCVFLFWQYLPAQSSAEEITTVAQVVVPLPEVRTISPEQVLQQSLKTTYDNARFLTVVNTTEKISHTNLELFCLAKNIYHEAANQSSLGKIAVAQVTLNRTTSPKFAGDICSVVFARNQFSWASDRNKRWSHPNNSKWNESMNIAREVLEGKRIKGMEHALYFHEDRIRPKWKHTARLAQIGDHIFYKQQK